MNAGDGEPLTMPLAEFSAVSGIPLYSLRQMVADGSLPCLKCGKRGVIRVLRIPALAMLGINVNGVKKG